MQSRSLNIVHFSHKAFFCVTARIIYNFLSMYGDCSYSRSSLWRQTVTSQCGNDGVSTNYKRRIYMNDGIARLMSIIKCSYFDGLQQLKLQHYVW